MSENTTEAPAVPNLPPVPAGPTLAAQMNDPAPAPAADTEQRAFFTDQVDAPYAGKVTLYGATFYYNPPSPAAKDFKAHWMEATAAKLGLSVEDFKGTTSFSDQSKQAVFTEASRELWRTITVDALVRWKNLPRAFSKEEAAKLFPDLHRDLFEAITGFVEFGVSEARFHQVRSAGAA